MGFSGSYEMSISQSRVLSVGQMPNPSRAAYFLLGLSSQNLTRANFSVQLFSQKPLTGVFVLDHARESADSATSRRFNALSSVFCVIFGPS